MRYIMKKYIPNILTTYRLIFSLFIPALFLTEHYYLLAIIFTLALLSDAFDGYFARLFKVQSDFGRCFDPIADKLLVSVALLLLVQFYNNIYLLIPAIIIICREILVSGLREFLATTNVKLRVTRLAKWKTAIQMTAITGLLLSSKNSNYTFEMFMNLFEVEPLMRVSLYGVIENVSLVLINVAALLTIITGYSYLRVGLKQMKNE